MPRTVYNALTEIRIRHTEPPARLHDGAGLYLNVHRAADGQVTRSWVVRYSADGRRRELGLGPYPLVSLKEARSKRDDVRRAVREGEDPVAKRREAEHARRLAQSTDTTFETFAQSYLRRRAPAWKNGEAAVLERERMFAAHAYPLIGKRPVRRVGEADVFHIIEPLSTTKPETARKLLQRLRAVLAHAIAVGAHPGPNPAAHEAIAPKLPVSLKEAAREKPHAALPVSEAPRAYASLCDSDAAAALVQRLIMLSAVRLSAANGARWEEIDGDVWTVPPERNKARANRPAPLRIPITPQMRTVLDAAGQRFGRDKGLIFPNRAGRPFSDVSVIAPLRARGFTATTHGMRATFRTWALDGGWAWELPELQLAHVLGNSVAARYIRGDALEQRRPMMERWGDYLAGGAQ